jgi:hypothetical protein
MMSSPEEQQRQATLLELARELCAVIERGEITAEEGATRIFYVWPRPASEVLLERNG